MKRILGVVLGVALLFAACSRTDDLNVGLTPQLGAPEVRAVNLAIGANTYAITYQRTYTNSTFDRTQTFSSATVSRFNTDGDVLWERDVIGYNHKIPPVVDFYPELVQSLIETDGPGNAYSFTTVSDKTNCPEVEFTADNKMTKLSPAGKQLWSKKITGAVDGFSVDRAGNIYLTGRNRNKQAEGCGAAFKDIYFFRKYAPNGALVWSRGLSDYPDSLAVTPWGSAFITVGGQLNRYTVAGTLLWSKKISYSGKPLFSKDHLYTLDSSSGRLSKYDLNGNLVWGHTYLGAKGFPDLIFNTLTVNPSGTIVLVGSYDPTSNDDSGTALRKLDAAGKTLWTRAFAPDISGDTPPISISSIGNRDNGGSLYLGGTSDSSSLVSKLDREGYELWGIR